MIQRRRRTASDVLLRLLDYSFDSDIYAATLSTLSKGIKVAEDNIERIGQEGRQEYVDAVIDRETEIIESLLGTAYVLCQTPITAVAQSALKVRKQAISDGLAFDAFGDKKHEVRALGDRFDAQFSKIEVMWALANYFKHRDEWSHSIWDNPTDRPASTIVVIKAVGLLPSSTGNMRKGAEALGNPDYMHLTVFEAIIRTWADEVRTVTRKVFGR